MYAYFSLIPGFHYAETDDGQGYILSDYCSADDNINVSIPAEYKGKPVIGIRSNAFNECIGLTAITIPSSVTDIGGNVFQDCTNLKSITVEQGNPKYHSAGNCLIETESKTLIAGCKTSVIPTDGSVTSIGYRAFAYCKNIASITIPDSVTNIDHLVFESCWNLTEIIYQGTKAQWKKINKSYEWFDYSYGVNNLIIRCTDGILDINGREIWRAIG